MEKAMSLDDWPNKATPDERAAFKLGRAKEQKVTRAQSRNHDKLFDAVRSIAAYFPTHPAGSIAQKALDGIKHHIQESHDDL
jgi:hypothetical protein